MKHLFFQTVATVFFSGVMFAQPTPDTEPIPLFENFGVIDDTSLPSPQIDAVAFANYGTFTVTTSPTLTDFPSTLPGPTGKLGFPPPSTIIPYDFQNTLNFTNTGTMNSFSGFRFDTAFADRPRQPALNFVNQFGANIFGSIFLQVASSNIVSQGILTGGPDGLIQLKGQTVNLSRSGLQIQRLGLDVGNCFFATPTSPVSTTNFFPDTGIFDLFANVFTNGNDVTSLISLNADGTVSVNAPFPLANLPRAKPFIRFTQTSATNLFFQAVFVQVRDTNVVPDVRFATFPRPPQGNNPPFLSPIVKMSATVSNVVTGNLEGQSVYLWDRLASEKVIGAETNLVYLTNVFYGTLMPSPYYLSRTAPCEYFFSSTGPNYTLTNNIFYDTSFSNNIVTNVGAYYGALVASTGSQLAAIPSGTLTNTTSRIEIEADVLDLNLARFQAAGVVSIKAKNLVTSSNSVVQAANLAFDLGSPLGNLLVKDLSLPIVPTFAGEVDVWSGYWTNETGFVGTNAMMPTIPDPADPAGTNMIPNLETNVIDIVFHALFVDNRMITQTGVTVYDLAMRGADVLFDDDMTVNHDLVIDAERFTISKAGRLTLTGAGFDSLTPTNAPSLSYFTNLGTLVIPNHADFGTASRPVASFVNAGSLTAFTEAFKAAQFENSGSISATGVMSIDAIAGKLDGGRLSAGSIRLLGSDLKMRNHNQTSVGLFIALTNSLSDSGGDAKNSLVTSGGFQLAVKPPTGDLLGTTLRTTAPRFANSTHAWAAEDRGATAAGYSNNVAIGRLELDAAQFGKLTFSGVGAKNGLYVDFLQIGPGLTNDVANNIQIDPNLVIYFADSNLPAEELDGKFGGHLRWVREFAGPNTTVDVIFCTNGVATTIKVNRVLRNSATIDSDDDGTANKFDPFPFNADALCQDVPNLPSAARITGVKLISQSPVSALLSLDVSPKQVYQIEYTTDLISPVWQVFSAFTNDATSGSYKLQLKEALPAGESQRFYRVRVNP